MFFWRSTIRKHVKHIKSVKHVQAAALNLALKHLLVKAVMDRAELDQTKDFLPYSRHAPSAEVKVRKLAIPVLFVVE